MGAIPSASTMAGIGNDTSDTCSIMAVCTVYSNQKFYFRDTGIYLYSSANGVLDIVSDTTIALSGAMTTDGALTMTMTDESAPIAMTNTVTTAGRTGCRAQFYVTTNVAVGSYINALKGYMEFSGTAGRTTGLASAVLAEMKLPNWAMTTGQYFPLEIELVGQTSSGSGAMSGFITARASGTLTNIDANSYFLQVEGLTAGSTAMLSTTSQTLKCRLGTQGSGADRYMVFSQMTDGLGFGNSSTAMDLGTSTTKRAIEIYTTSASTSTGTSVRPIYMLHEATGTGGVGHRAEFHTRCNVVLGTWSNALKGYWEWDNAAGDGTGGRSTGLSSAVCAELKMPDAAVSTGHYYPLELEFVGQTNSGPGVHHGFITMRASGTLTNFNASGFVFDFQGITPGSGAMIDTDPANKTDGNVEATMKIQVGTTTYYIPLWDKADGSA